MIVQCLTWFAWTIIGLVVGICCESRAEAPQVTRLLPAGGKRGTAFEVTAVGKFAPWPVVVTDSSGGLNWQPAGDAGKFQVTIAEDAPLGVHWLRFSSADGAAKLKPFIVGSYPEQNEQEPNEAVKQATVISSFPIAINGVLEQARDVDTFAVDLEEGQQLVATLTANEELASPVDACMQVLDAKGFVVAQNLDAHNLDPQIVYQAKQSGKYLVRVFGFPSAPDSTIAFSGSNQYVYRLTLTAAAHVESPMPPAVSAVADTTLSWVGYNSPMPGSRTVTSAEATEALEDYRLRS
ncbi:MAG: PPC domain-containing protein [Pirellulales bacterium]